MNLIGMKKHSINAFYIFAVRSNYPAIRTFVTKKRGVLPNESIDSIQL